MNQELLNIAHQTLFGGISAAGFGVLFNLGYRDLGWSFAVGSLALLVRTLGLNAGWSLEAASFIAAIALSAGVSTFLKPLLKTDGATIALAGCIPMIPGSFLIHAILGMFSLTAPEISQEIDTVVMSLKYLLRVVFTIGAIGTGLALPMYIMKAIHAYDPDAKQSS